MKYVLSVLFILSSLVVYAQGGNITISQWEGLHAEQKQVAKKHSICFHLLGKNLLSCMDGMIQKWPESLFIIDN